MDDEALPTGHQHRITHGSHSVVVTSVGATLRSYSYGGTDVIRSFPAGDRSPAGHGQVLAPWPNRLRDGAYTWNGQSLQVPLSEPARGNAIHGLVRWQEWSATEVGEDRVTLVHRIHPRDGYPFLVQLAITYSLAEDGLTVRTMAVNLGAGTAPFGLGFHPYLVAGNAAVDDLELTVPARVRLVADDRGLPVASEAVAGTPFDFTAAKPVGNLVLDTAFGDLVREPDGRARVVLRSPTADWRCLWVDQSFGHLMVFTGDTLSPDLARRAVAVEPMTCPPNALASGTDVIVLEPGAGWEGSWGIEAS